jgi:AcrR family transcriptional regulator
MAKPLIQVEAIYARALELLDIEGSAGLTTRRLATDLKISTRTLYQQVGSRDRLIRALVARHFSQLRVDFHELAEWEDTALHWCLSLREALYAHPYLTELMTVEDRGAIMDYVSELVEVTLRQGIPQDLAVECCRALVNLTINHAIVEVRGSHQPELSRESTSESALIERNFPMSVRWILSGVRMEAQQISGLRADPGRQAV